MLGVLVALLMCSSEVSPTGNRCRCADFFALVLADLVSANRNFNQGMSWPELRGAALR